MEKTGIYFDMDGTIADLYGVKGWLEKLDSHDPTPYMEALVMHRMATLARLIRKVQKKGYTVGIISWLAKHSNAEYDKAVEQAKRYDSPKAAAFINGVLGSFIRSKQ